MELTDARILAEPPFAEAAAADGNAAAGPATNRVHTPPDVRTSALVIIALFVVLAAVHLAAAFLIPLVVSIFLSYALSPLVARLQAWRVPRVVGAPIVMVVFVALCGAAVYRAGSDAADLLELLPQAVEKVRVSFAAWQREGVNPAASYAGDGGRARKARRGRAACDRRAARPSLGRSPGARRAFHCPPRDRHGDRRGRRRRCQCCF